MNIQILPGTRIFPRWHLVLFYLLLLFPYFLPAHPIFSFRYTLKQHEAAGVVLRSALPQDETLIKDTLGNPGLPPTYTDFVEATYRGGAREWMMHLNRTLRYPHEALMKKIQGTVTVKFLVDTKGRVKKPEATGGPVELRTEAIRVIRESGRWIPAQLNGEFIESYKQQTLIFKCE